MHGWTTGRGRRHLAGLTPLNLRISERYERCAGEHRPSGATVTRTFADMVRVLPVCRRCKVPYGVPRRYGESKSVPWAVAK